MKMTLRDILPINDIPTIEERCTFPKWSEEYEKGETMLTGFCAWINGELISLDGDIYSLDTEIIDWFWDEVDGDERLVYVYDAEWEKPIV